MTKESYDRVEKWFTARPGLLDLMKGLNRWLPRVVYCAYPLLLAMLALRRDGRFFRVLLVPAAAFAAVTVLRELWNFPRPYEELDIHPLIPREKSGHSFPSRHVASAAVIAVAFWYVWPPAGIVLSVIALLIAAIRPLAGIHFPRDVIVGMGFGLIIGIAGFWFL